MLDRESRLVWEVAVQAGSIRRFAERLPPSERKVSYSEVRKVQIEAGVITYAWFVPFVKVRFCMSPAKNEYRGAVPPPSNQSIDTG